MAEAIRWDWIDRHSDEIVSATVAHLGLVATAVAVASAIAIPVGILARGSRAATAAVISTAQVLYTIPSIAMFGFLLPFTGIGRLPVTVALVIYALLAIVRNTIVGLQGVPAPVLEAARGMGLTRIGTLRRVELPLALPAILSGIRVATVSTVGIATIGVLIAGPGLGQQIYTQGLNRDLFLTPILVGTVLATVLAILCDLALLGVERLATPWARRAAAR